MIGEQLRRERGRLDMTQQELSDALGVGRRTVQRWETGAPIPINHQARIAALLARREANPLDAYQSVELLAEVLRRRTWNGSPGRWRRSIASLRRSCCASWATRPRRCTSWPGPTYWRSAQPWCHPIQAEQDRRAQASSAPREAAVELLTHWDAATLGARRAGLRALYARVDVQVRPLVVQPIRHIG